MGNKAQIITPGSAPASLAGMAGGLLRMASADPATAIARFRGLAPLPKNTNELFDNVVVGIGRDRLAIADDAPDPRVKALALRLATPRIVDRYVGIYEAALSR